MKTIIAAIIKAVVSLIIGFVEVTVTVKKQLINKTKKQEIMQYNIKLKTSIREQILIA
ncbi:MAG: hypothetical protein RSB77_07290 [Bacilli bacterium]